MNYEDNITTGDELQEKLLHGIEKVSAVIRQSYGKNGANVSLEEELWPGHRVVNDALSIITKIHLGDPVERRGLNFIRELMEKQSSSSGEGRKTTLIIAETLLKEGFKEKVKGMKLKEELDALLPRVLESIDKQSQPIEIKDIQKVAETSSRSKEIGEWIQKIYNEVGKDGIIYCEGSGTFDTSYEVNDGVVLNGATWWHPSMAHDEEAVKAGHKEERAIYYKPSILFTKSKIRKVQEISEFMNAMSQAKKDLIIFTDDIDLNVLNVLAAAHRGTQALPKVMNILVIKAPGLWKDQIFTDFAKCTGADILEEGSGISFENLTKAVNNGTFKLGTCDKLITDGEGTVISGIQDISDYKKTLEEKGDNESKRRLWRLNARTALLKLGAGSESELSYKLLKTNDALSACRASLLEGVVEGGSKSLLKAGQDLAVAEGVGGIFGTSLMAPYKQLVENNGGEDFDTTNVYDATYIIKNCVKNALSLAGIVLTTKADIRLREKTLEDAQLEVLNQQRFNFNNQR